jgi:hypothetical protein
VAIKQRAPEISTRGDRQGMMMLRPIEMVCWHRASVRHVQ